MMQELPQRFALDRGTGRVQCPAAARGAEDRLLDLLGRRRRFRVVVEAHVDRAKALGAQARHQAGAQQRRLAEARLAEQHGEQLALHAARELGGLFVAAVEVGACLLGVGGQAEPGIFRIDA